MLPKSIHSLAKSDSNRLGLLTAELVMHMVTFQSNLTRPNPTWVLFWFLKFSDCNRPFVAISGTIYSPQNTAGALLTHFRNRLKTQAIHVHVNCSSECVQLVIEAPIGLFHSTGRRIWSNVFEKMTKNVRRSDSLNSWWPYRCGQTA